MKQFVLFYILSFFVICLSAQPKTWDSTYRPGRYDEKLAVFNSYPNSKKDIIFFGNSITEYANWDELLSNRHAINRGISGDISFGLLQRIQEISIGKPAKVFILIGINDISRNIPDSIIIDNYKKIIDHLQSTSPKTKIYWSTIFPVNDGFAPRNHFNKDEHIIYINNALKKLGAATGITVIDAYSFLKDEQNKLKKAYTYDGLHLNSIGYLKYAELIQLYL